MPLQEPVPGGAAHGLTDALRASDEAEAEFLATLDEAEAAQFRGMLRRIALRA